MDFERAEPIPVKFSLLEKITVRQQLAYYSACMGVDPTREVERWWAGATALIVPESWKCELIPDFRTLSLDEVDDPNITVIILWASMAVRMHVNSLGTVSKN